MTQLADVMEATAIHPLHVDAPEAELTALRRRIQHKVLIELVDAEGNVFTARPVAFHSSGKKGRP